MIVDTSALVCILKAEPQRQELLQALHEAPSRSISAATLVEARIVVHTWQGPLGRRLLDRMIEHLDIAVLPVSTRQADIAAQAHADFGRGSGSPARLNLGDCFSYALAHERDEPLLFVGEDFIHTDLRLRPPSPSGSPPRDPMPAGPSRHHRSP